VILKRSIAPRPEGCNDIKDTFKCCREDPGRQMRRVYLVDLTDAAIPGVTGGAAGPIASKASRPPRFWNVRHAIAERIAMRDPSSTVARAGELVRRGEMSEARDELLEVTGRQDIDRSTLEEAILWMGRAGFEEDATRLVDLYAERFRERPETDHEAVRRLIKQRAEAVRRTKGRERRVHRRLTTFSRGWPGRYLPFEPGLVREITLDDEGISIRRLWRTRTYRWDEIVGAELERQRSHTGVGYTRIEYVRRRLRIVASDGEHVFDLSDVLPEFHRPDLIEQDIRRYVPVRTLEIRPISERDEHKRSATVVVLFAGFVVAASWVLERLN
jgi:hypothetical protein